MKKNKLYSVVYIPDHKQQPYISSQQDTDVNKVWYRKAWTESDYIDGITRYPEKWGVQVYAKDKEDSILKSEKLINKYIKEQKNGK